jgi:hypothetical protein
VSRRPFADERVRASSIAHPLASGAGGMSVAGRVVIAAKKRTGEYRLTNQQE